MRNPKRSTAIAAAGLYITFLGGGSIHVRGFDRADVTARLEPDDEGRFEIKELHVRGAGQRVDSGVLQSLRTARLEQVLNLPRNQRELYRTLDRPGVDFAAAIAAAAADVGGPGAGDIPIFSSRRRRRVHKKPRTRTPQSFYRDVANAYRRAIEIGQFPHRFIAGEAQVSDHTAQWWIKETRRLGYLGKAQPGRTGAVPKLRIRNVGTRTESLQLVDAADGGPELIRPGETIAFSSDYALDLLEDEATWQPAPEG